MSSSSIALILEGHCKWTKKNGTESVCVNEMNHTWKIDEKSRRIEICTQILQMMSWGRKEGKGSAQTTKCGEQNESEEECDKDGSIVMLSGIERDTYNYEFSLSISLEMVWCNMKCFLACALKCSRYVVFTFRQFQRTWGCIVLLLYVAVWASVCLQYTP